MRAGAALTVIFSATVCGAFAADPVQSTLHPVSPEARELAKLWWVMFWVCGVVFVAVVVFMFQSIWSKKDAKPPGGVMPFIVGGGIVLPTIVLIGFLIYSLRVTVMLMQHQPGETIEVIGRQFWWEVRYPDHGIVTANELHIPVGEQVRVVLESADVIHSFWIPNLHGKRDMIPGITNELWIQAERPGEWRGQCAEFCGLQHALMAFVVVALERDDYDAWVSSQQAAAQQAAQIGVVVETDAPVFGEQIARGREVFLRNGCVSCHAIEGMPEAMAGIGPDLTHIGSRRTLGAGTIPNNAGNLAGWIANPQAIKPGNLMPPTYLEPADLHALVEYLQSLE